MPFAQRAGGAGVGAVELARRAARSCSSARRVVVERPRPAQPLLDRPAGRARAGGRSRCAPCAARSAAPAPRRRRRGSPSAAPWRRRSRTGSPARDRGRARPGRRAARVATVAFSVEPSQSPSGILTPVGGDPERDDVACGPCSSSPSSIITARRTSSSRRLISSASAARGCARRTSRETDDFDVDRAARSTSLADRLLRAPVAAGRDAGEHPLQHRPASAGRGRRSTRRSRSGSSALRRRRVRTRGRSTATRRPPSVTSPASCPCRTAARSGSCLPFGPTTSSTSSSISSASTPSPTPTLSASSPSFADPDQLPERLLHARRQHAPPAASRPARAIRSLHGGSSFDLTDSHPPRSQRERTRREGPPPQVLRATGQPRGCRVLRALIPARPQVWGHRCSAFSCRPG